MIILQTSDFVGFFKLAISTEITPVLQAYIDRYEAKYIRKLLGINLGNAFIADKSEPTQDPVYAVIEQPFQVEDDNVNHESLGMKHLLASMVFYHFTVDMQSSHSQSGVIRRALETALQMTSASASRMGEKKWNDSIPTWREIQWYVDEYAPEDYADPAFNGEKISPQWGSIM